MMYPPPSYLTGLIKEVSTEILSKIQEEYGDYTTAFQFDNKFSGLIFSWSAEHNEYGGRVWGVESTGSKLVIFDQVKHGYNGMMQLNEEDDINTTKSIDLLDDQRVIIAFQYSGDEAEYLEDGISKCEQDYFGWVALYEHIDNRIQEIISFECA